MIKASDSEAGRAFSLSSKPNTKACKAQIAVGRKFGAHSPFMEPIPRSQLQM